MKNILIYGRGKVGNSLAHFCDFMEYSYTICDDSDAPEDFSSFEKIIPSPGIPSSHKIYETDIIVSELDFLFPHIPTGFQIHAITGTDGKSTTAWILYHFLKSGLPDSPVYLGGNFGTPLADIIGDIKKNEQKSGHIVLEVSSFMAYNIKKFTADNTILTNLHPDHLDWHKNLHEYYNAKLNLLGHTRGTILYPQSVLSIFPEIKDFPMESVCLGDEIIQAPDGILQLSQELFLDISERQLYGDHNIKNIFFAASLAVKMGITVKELSAILANIPALPHRLQKVSGKDNKVWIDDSKSTTAQSLYAALAAFAPQKVYLIAGGKDKGDPFENLAENLQKYCVECVAIGETKHIFLQAAHDAYIPAIPSATMEDAVSYLAQNTREGDIILLSPGCSSFDMFQNYEERAEKFRSAIEVN
ncbi:MAG: UDP-N-acetylmuramoyl-L-alanine--D-glutamate ligase [Candidatus Gracilibacteria bacterium]